MEQRLNPSEVVSNEHIPLEVRAGERYDISSNKAPPQTLPKMEPFAKIAEMLNSR